MDNIYAAKVLITSGADVNSRDKELWTPLHIASAFARLEIVQLLLEVSFISVTMPTVLPRKITVKIQKSHNVSVCDCLW